MIDKTVLELVDRLVATNTRATQAEIEAEKWKDQNASTVVQLGEANSQILVLQAEVKALQEKLKESGKSMEYWADKAWQFEKELKKLKEPKDDTNGN